MRRPHYRGNQLQGSAEYYACAVSLQPQCLFPGSSGPVSLSNVHLGRGGGACVVCVWREGERTRARAVWPVRRCGRKRRSGKVLSSGCRNVPVRRPGGCFQAKTGALGADGVRPETETEEPASRWLADPSGTTPYPTAKSKGLGALGSQSLAELPRPSEKQKTKKLPITGILNWRDTNPEFASWGTGTFIPTWPSRDVNPRSQCEAFWESLYFGDNRAWPQHVAHRCRLAFLKHWGQMDIVIWWLWQPYAQVSPVNQIIRSTFQNSSWEL